jgi:hypothetical protein
MSMPPAPAPSPAIPRVTPAPGSRLEQLMGMREAADAALAEAKAKVKAIEAGIMAEAAAAFPGAPAVDIAGSPHWAAQRMRWHDGKLYVPAEALRTKHRDVWDELVQRGKGYWQLHDLSSP